MRRMRIEDLLGATPFETDEQHPHIVIDNVGCRTCPSNRACEYSCPAQRFVWDEARDLMTFDHVGCVECGNCRLVCDRLYEGAPGYSWDYPQNGAWVTYRHG